MTVTDRSQLVLPVLYNISSGEGEGTLGGLLERTDCTFFVFETNFWHHSCLRYFKLNLVIEAPLPLSLNGTVHLVN